MQKGRVGERGGRMKPKKHGRRFVSGGKPPLLEDAAIHSIEKEESLNG